MISFSKSQKIETYYQNKQKQAKMITLLKMHRKKITFYFLLEKCQIIAIIHKCY